MKFNFFHTMPWTHYEGVPESWPVSSNGFDAERARLLYDDYITSMIYAEECGFDWVGCNEHHYTPYGLMSQSDLIGPSSPTAPSVAWRRDAR